MVRLLNMDAENVPSANMEEAGFMTYTITNHRGAIQMFWLHFGQLSCRPSLYSVYRYISDRLTVVSWNRDDPNLTETSLCVFKVLNQCGSRTVEIPILHESHRLAEEEEEEEDGEEDGEEDRIVNTLALYSWGGRGG